MISRRQFTLNAAVLGTLVVGPPSLAMPAPSPRLSIAQIKADIALLEEAYQRIHPGYLRYTTMDEISSRWRAIVQMSEKNGGLSLADFYLAIQRVLTSIRCDHTKAELPPALLELRSSSPTYLPFRWQLVEGRGFIRKPLPDSPLDFGDELLVVDGIPLARIVDKVSNYVPVDGYTDWARRAGISESLEFQGGAVDHFGSLIWPPPPIVELRIKKRSGEEKTVSLARITFDAWTSLADTEAGASDFRNAVSLNEIANGLALLRVDSFVNYRNPVDPVDILGPIFDQIASVKYSSLILDLRRNGGGSTDASHSLFSHLIQRPMPIKTDMRVKTLDFTGLKENLIVQDPSLLDPNPLGFDANKDGTYSLKSFVSDELGEISPAQNAFSGQLLILSSDQNSSGSTNIISVLQSSGRAIVVGERTGGSSEGPTAGILFFLELPESQIRTRLPVIRYTNNVKAPQKGLGVVPDVPAPMTITDFLDRKDPALEQALILAGST